jgi:hypothetical protein
MAAVVQMEAALAAVIVAAEEAAMEDAVQMEAAVIAAAMEAALEIGGVDGGGGQAAGIRAAMEACRFGHFAFLGPFSAPLSCFLYSSIMRRRHRLCFKQKPIAGNVSVCVY